MRHVHVEQVMGTAVSLDVRGADPVVARRATAELVAWLHDADARFSPFREDSEVCRIDRGALDVADASQDVRDVLARCERLREETGGAFDARVRGVLDPSALVKGWAAQRGADLLRAAGLTDFCLNAGGDCVVRGGALPHDRWRIGIRHPRDPDAVARTLALTDAAVATSGLYERGAHLFDPRTGGAPEGILSVTVVGPDLGLADAYSTAAFALGTSGPTWTLTLPTHGYEALTIRTDDRILSTPNFPPTLT
jgi:thiamine biosynthesis lipoprotein